MVGADLGVLADDSDVDGDGLSAVLDGDVSHGTLALAADGSFSYSPGGRLRRQRHVHLPRQRRRARLGRRDGHDHASAASTTPRTRSTTRSSPTEDTALVLPLSGAGSPAANDTDPDGDSLAGTAVAATATGGTVALAGGHITFTPSHDACGIGAGSFGYTVSDGTLSDDGVVTVNIGCVNDAPVLAAIGDQAVAEGATVTVPLTAGDVDGDSLSFSLDAGAPVWATLTDAGDGTASLELSPGFGDAAEPTA